MANLDVKAKTTEDELLRLQTELNHLSIAGHQSEPTTPPEYHNGFSNRSNRLSLASLTSPFLASSGQLPSTSVPGSRRNSDEDEEDQYEKEIKNVNTRRTPGYVNILFFHCFNDFIYPWILFTCHDVIVPISSIRLWRQDGLAVFTYFMTTNTFWYIRSPVLIPGSSGSDWLARFDASIRIPLQLPLTWYYTTFLMCWNVKDMANADFFF